MADINFAFGESSTEETHRSTSPRERKSNLNQIFINAESTLTTRHSSPGDYGSAEKRRGVVDFGNFQIQVDTEILQEFDPIPSNSRKEKTLSNSSENSEDDYVSRLNVEKDRSLVRHSAPGDLLVPGIGAQGEGDEVSNSSSSELGASNFDLEVNRDETFGGNFEHNRFDDDLERDAKKELEQLDRQTAGNTPSSDEKETTALYPSISIEDDFHGIARHRIVSVAGADKSGRLLIVFSACRIPPIHCIDHHMLFLYIKHTLDQYVESDYTIVYFHYGLTSKNKPSFSWLLQIYKELDRKYRKNVKAMFIVHPSNIIKIVWGFFRKVASHKFAKKVTYVNYLQELAEHVHLKQLDIPKEVQDHDDHISSRYKPKAGQSVFHTSIPDIPQTQQFGVSLSWLRENNEQEFIPSPISVSVNFIREEGLDVEGIFRRSANSQLVKRVAEMFNHGQPVVYSEFGDIHCAAAIIKKFLREMPEPLLSYELFDIVTSIIAIADRDQKLMETWSVLHNQLPEQNFILLKYIMEFLKEVQEHPTNKMTSSNLAIVFGPNLVWARTQASSFDAMAQINTFTCLMLDNVDYLFRTTSS